jgi:D-xylose transport system permease protein
MKRTLILLLAIAAVWVFFHILSDGAVLTAGNMVNLFKYLAVVGILAVGMTLVMASGHIDLSVGSGLGLLGAVQAWLLYRGHWPLPAALAASASLALALGALHGALVAYARVPAFIVTLGGLMSYMGLKQFLANPVIPIQDPLFLALGQGHLPAWAGYGCAALASAGLAAWLRRRAVSRRAHGLPGFTPGGTLLAWALPSAAVFGLAAAGHADRGVPVCVLAMGIAALIGHGLAAKTRFGRHVFAIGSNREAAHYAGIAVSLHTVGVFAFMALLTWLAGLVATTQLMAAAADIGDYQELYAIAACVIGGTSLRGGTGNVWMSILGALLMASILNGMEQVGIPSTMQKVILGVILIASVALDQVWGRSMGRSRSVAHPSVRT